MEHVAVTVDQLAALVRGRVVGDGTTPIQAARPVNQAGPGDITFIEDERYAKLLRVSPASAAIVGPHFKRAGVEREQPLSVIEVDDPLGAFVTVMSHLRGDARPRWTGIHPQACVAPTARIGSNVAIHAFVFVGEEVEIGDDCTLHPGVVLQAGCKLGRGVVLHPRVVLYERVTLGDRVEVHSGAVLGGDGFGYRLAQGKHVKIPQTGTLEIGPDVEIGANCAIDRGTFEATRVGEGTKIDNLVMVGHNNQIGRHNLLCGQVGLAGSCTTGDYVVMAGQAGIKDHVEIGDRAIVGAQAGVHRNIPAGQQVLGAPAIPVKEQREVFAMIARLPEMRRQLKDLARQLEGLTRSTGAPRPPDHTKFEE